jgi:hypothetical protein
MSNWKWTDYPVELFKNYGDLVAFFDECQPREWVFVFKDDAHDVWRLTMCGYTAYQFVREVLDEVVMIHVNTEDHLVCSSSLCNPVDEDGAF